MRNYVWIFSLSYHEHCSTILGPYKLPPHLVEQIQQTIMHDGVEVLHTAPVEGVHDPVVPHYRLVLGLQVFTVDQLKDVLGSLGALIRGRGRGGGV